MKKIYGIGTGPGDPELLTIKGIRAIERASVIFAPNNKGTNMALDTACEYIRDKKLVLIDLPMGNVTQHDYTKAAKRIYEEIPHGECGAFLTIGDPMIYSTFIYIMEELKGKDIEVEIIPGIPSFVAAAAQTKTPLTVKGDSFLLCDEWDKDLADRVDSMALLKTLRDKEEVLKQLEEQGFEYRYVKRGTLPEEQILTDRDEIVKDSDYISLIMARKNKDQKGASKE